MKIKELAADAKEELAIEHQKHIKKCIIAKLKEIDKAEQVVDALREDYERFLKKDSSEIDYPQNRQCY